MSYKKAPGCVFPDCEHCPLKDCETYGCFPGESKRNAYFGELPGSKAESKRKREKEYAQNIKDVSMEQRSRLPECLQVVPQPRKSEAEAEDSL